MFGDGDVIELLVDSVDGDNSIFIDSDVVDVDGVCWLDWICFRVEFVPLLVTFVLIVDESCWTVEYDWSLTLLQAIDCVDGCVVRTVSFCETVDVLRWCRWIWCCVVGGVWVDGVELLSIGAFPLVSAAIFEKTSFLVIVGDEQGLTDGVLLADIVLFLIENQNIE